MEQDVALLQRHQPRLPRRRDRAFLGQQRARAELEHDLAKLGIVDPVVPFVEAPNATGHDDRNAVGDPALAHRFAQCLDPWVRVLWLARVFGVGQAIVPAGQPRVLIDHRGKPFCAFE